MALSRFVLTTDVTIPAGTPSGSPNEFGIVGWSGPAGPPIQWGAGFATTLKRGMVIYADGGTPASPATGPQQLFAAIGSGNLRAYVQGQDDIGHSTLAN